MPTQIFIVAYTLGKEKQRVKRKTTKESDKPAAGRKPIIR